MKNSRDIVILSKKDNCKIRIRTDMLNNISFKCSHFLYVREVSALLESLKVMQRYYDARHPMIDPLNWLKGNFRTAGIEFQSRNNLITVKHKTWIMALKNATT